MDPQLLEALKQMGLGATPMPDVSAPIVEPTGHIAPIEAQSANEMLMASKPDAVQKLIGAMNDGSDGGTTNGGKEYSLSAQAPRPSGDSDLVKAYLAKMSQNQSPDQGLLDAQNKAKNNRLMLQAFGPQPSGANAAVAYQLAGIKGPEEQTNYSDPDQPVKDYIAAKESAGKSNQEDLKNLDQLAQLKDRESLAQSRQDAMDPSSPKYQVAMAKLNAQANSLEARKKQIEVSAAKGLLTADHMKEWADVTQKLADVKESSNRLSYRKQGITESQGVVRGAESQDNPLAPGEASKVNERLAGAETAMYDLKKLRQLVAKGQMGLFNPDSDAGEVQTLYQELAPNWNSAMTDRAYTGARGTALHNAIQNPQSFKTFLKNLISGDHFSTSQLDTAEGLIREGAKNITEQRGIHGYEVGGEKKKPKSNMAPLENTLDRGQKSQEDSGSTAGLGKIRMVGPDGKTGMVDAKRVKAAVAAGYKVAE